MTTEQFPEEPFYRDGAAVMGIDQEDDDQDDDRDTADEDEYAEERTGWAACLTDFDPATGETL